MYINIIHNAFRVGEYFCKLCEQSEMKVEYLPIEKGRDFTLESDENVLLLK